MNIVNTVSTKYFTLNGIQYARIYQPLVQGSVAIGIYSIFDTRQQLLSSINFDQYNVDGTIYGTQALTIAALLDVIWLAEAGLIEPSEGDVKDFYVAGTITKKVYQSAVWVSTGITKDVDI